MQNYHYEKCYEGQMNSAIKGQKGIWVVFGEMKQGLKDFSKKLTFELRGKWLLEIM